MAYQKHPQAAVLVGALHGFAADEPIDKTIQPIEILHIAIQRSGDPRDILGAQW